jgi:alpha-galactosidase
MQRVTATALVDGTVYARSDDRFWLVRLCQLTVGREGLDGGPGPAQGVAVLTVDGQRYEAGQLALDHVDEAPGCVACRWRVGRTAVRLTTRWSGDPATAVVSRNDTLTNTGDTPVIISRCLARLALPPGRYECYSQLSRWCHENQGEWQRLHTGLRLSHLSGRTTEGATPYLGIRSAGTGQGLACHLLPCGNWTIRVAPVAEGGEWPFAVVELGLADENLYRRLEPGQSLALPSLLFQALPEGEVHLAAPALHRWLLTHPLRAAKPEAPVVFNSWFDQFEILDVPRLRRQLAAAQEIGCEVLAIDAGWYGAGGPDWGAQTGDWREKTEAAFAGHMGEFAAEVRAAGLGFGLWMEPERFGPQAPIRAEHPEWFVPVGGNARLDLTQSPARAWLRAEIGRLVDTYRLAWMKIDFNFALDADASGAELSDYMALWYGVLDEVRAAYPNTFFEGCSSGAMRADLETLRHVDGHFLSDSVNPTDMLRITQGAWLRLPPGRLTRWTVVRAVAQAVPEYRRTVADSPPLVLVPGGAVWSPVESTGLDLALLAAAPGMLGFSGDLAGLPPEYRAQMAATVARFKQWRQLITRAVGHLLTSPLPLEAREGWVGFQLQDLAGDRSLVFVYRLGAAGSLSALPLRGLVPAQAYTLCWWGQEGTASDRRDGDSLMRDGLPLRPGSDRAAVCAVCADRTA